MRSDYYQTTVTDCIAEFLLFDIGVKSNFLKFVNSPSTNFYSASLLKRQFVFEELFFINFLSFFFSLSRFLNFFFFLLFGSPGGWRLSSVRSQWTPPRSWRRAQQIRAARRNIIFQAATETGFLMKKDKNPITEQQQPHFASSTFCFLKGTYAFTLIFYCVLIEQRCAR